MSEGKRIGRMVDGRFVSDDDGPVEELTPDKGYMASDAIRDRYARAPGGVVDEQLETLEHVVASIDVAAMTLQQLERAAMLAKSMTELWVEGMRKRGRL